MDIDVHNEYILSKCKVGDLLELPGDVYSHWGVYVGNGNVIHFTCQEANIVSCCSPVGKKKGKVLEESFWKVAGTSKVKINNLLDHLYKKLDSPEKIVERARSVPKETEYECGGCEYFATWCRYGKRTSRQIQKWQKVLLGFVVLFIVSYFLRRR